MTKISGSLFTGGDLAGAGAIAAGYSLAWGVELDPAIAEVANHNFSYGDRCHAASVVGFPWAKLDPVDHLHISPPCTRASAANNDRGETQLDLDLARASIEALGVLLPSTVTLENVIGYRHFESFKVIVNELYRLGYWPEWSIINAADVGVPQTRKRIILRAVRGGYLSPLPAPVEWVSWYSAIEDLIPSLPEAKLGDWQIAHLMKLVIGQPVMIHANEQRSLKLRWVDEPAFTQTAGGDSERAPGCNHKFLFPDGTVKRETVRSKARIQSVPDWYDLSGCAVGLAQKILGNGVPSLLMQRIMGSLHP